MYAIAHERDLRAGRSRTATFEGKDHMSGVSFFHVDNETGQGPEVHTHPYSETFIVLSGEAVITVDGEEIGARKGDVVVADAGTPHRFRNSGSGRLELMCIHASPRFETEWLDEESGAPS
jgi:mannose-6-phosphate isomerase-like protein (cupin superfamily)